MKKSVDLFTHEKADPLMPDWGHSEAYSWLRQMELELGDKQAEKPVLKKLWKLILTMAGRYNLLY